MAKLPTDKHMAKSNSHTLPPSPTHSSSSSDFEFTISISPRKCSSSTLCPADDLFRDGHLLPLHHPSSHHSPTVVPSSSSASAARDSSGSSNDSQHSLFTATDCDSSRPSSVTDDDDVKRFYNPLFFPQSTRFQSHREINKTSVTNKYLSSTFSRFSSVFRKEPGKARDPDSVSGSSVRRVSATAREVVRKYLKKVKPLYEKFSASQKQHQNHQHHRTEAVTKPTSFSSLLARTERSTMKEPAAERKQQTTSVMLSLSFSGNLRRLRRKRSCVSSCPSSMRSSPTHSSALPRSGGGGGGMYYGSYNSSTMEELQSAIQGAIAHCKNSWTPEKPVVTSEI